MNFILFILSLSFNMQIGFRCFLNPSDVVANNQMHTHTHILAKSMGICANMDYIIMFMGIGKAH